MIKIINGKFYIDDTITNSGNLFSEGRLIGVYTDICAFFDENINIIDIERNKKDFIENLYIWRKSGVNLITVGLQSPNPFDEYYKKVREQDKSKDISFKSSAIKSDGSLDYIFLENTLEIIKAADNLGFAVLVNILSSSSEDMFDDEFALINGIFNAVDWIVEAGGKNYNILVNITDISHTFYKSSVLNGDRIIKLFKSIRKKTGEDIILGAGIKTYTNISEKNIEEYISLSDFIPIYANYTKSNHNTKKMLENIFFLKNKTISLKTPIIMVKGDDLSEKYNSYGKNNLIEALENNISWCYYDKYGFVIPANKSINWDINSSPKKKKFAETIRKIAGESLF